MVILLSLALYLSTLKKRKKTEIDLIIYSAVFEVTSFNFFLKKKRKKRKQETERD